MKKAFTLVELLGVIVVLGIIATITVPLVQRTILENTEEAYQDQIISFERAAKNYVASDIYNMTANCQEPKICPISLDELQKKGYLPSGEIINPKTDKSFDMENTVDISYNGKSFSYNYDETQDNS